MQQTRRQPQSILSRPPHARAGFAALFFSYFIVSFLLMYTLTLMTRSSTEMHSAERSADLQQAFWAAEGQLESTIAELRLSTPPVLAANVCKDLTGQDDYSAWTTLSSGAQSRYRICGTSATNNYVLEATGVSGTTTHLVSTVITYAADTLQFSQAALAQHISLTGYTTGYMNGLTDSLQASQVIQSPENAGLATTETKPYYSFSDMTTNNCELQTWPWISTTSSGNSRIGGRLLVGPGGNADDPQMIEVIGRPPVGGKGAAETLPRLPDVEVPSQAVDLGALEVGQSNVSDASAAGRLCLSSGIYKASSVSLATDSELCTVGPVSLYVTGEGGANNSVWLSPGAKIYGQPKTAIEGTGANAHTVAVQPYDGKYYPANLRLFVKDGAVWLGQNGSLTAAVVYAPRSNVIAPVNSTLLGSVTAWYLDYGPPLPWSGTQNTGLPNYMIYDESLKGATIPVGPVDIGVKMWGEGVTAEQQLARFIRGTNVTSRTSASDANPGEWPGAEAQELRKRALEGLSAMQPGVDACNAANNAETALSSANDAAADASTDAQRAYYAHSAKQAADAAEDAAAAAQSASAAAASAQTALGSAQTALAAAQHAADPRSDVIGRASAKVDQASQAAQAAQQAADNAQSSATYAQAQADSKAASEAAAGNQGRGQGPG